MSQLSHEWRPLKNTQFCSRSRKARILTTGIPVVFRGLEFESDAACPVILSRRSIMNEGGSLGQRRKIGQKGVFFKGLE
jgi:hypothetical protein